MQAVYAAARGISRVATEEVIGRFSLPDCEGRCFVSECLVMYMSVSVCTPTESLSTMIGSVCTVTERLSAGGPKVGREKVAW